MEECNPKTLYVGNLDHSVSEDLLVALFGQMGAVKGCKIIREAGNDPYAFIDFINHQAASTALTAMNKRSFLEKEMKVNWATSPGNQPKTDTSGHHHIFVGDLSPEIETETLREAFAPFGEISNCRIVRDTHTLKSRGYAFVSFVKRAEAENAIAAMNGQWLGSRSIRTNWSTRKPPAPRDGQVGPGGKGPGMGGGKGGRPLYDEVYGQTSATNTTVYCGGFPGNVISEDMMHKHFGLFGTIQDVRVFKDKGFAFIKFMTKDAAAHAIEHTHNTDIGSYPVKCFWGKVNGGEIGMPQPLGAHVMAAAAAAAAAAQAAGNGVVGGPGGMVGGGVGGVMGPGGPGGPGQQAQMGGLGQAGAMGAGGAGMASHVQPQGAQYPYSYGQMAGYWYQPAYPAATQMPAQYMQQPGYPAYSAYTYTPQQAGYRMVQQPNGAWGVQTTAMPGAMPNGSGAGQPQPQMMYTTTPMPQYQAQ